MRLIMPISNYPNKTLNLSGFTVLGAIGWNFTSFTVGLLAGADNLGALNSINGASFRVKWTPTKLKALKARLF